MIGEMQRPGAGMSATTEGLIGVQEAAALHGVSEQRIRQLCAAGRIKGAQKVGGSGVWVMPPDAERISVDWPQTQRRDD